MIFIFINLLVDILYAWLDPRIGTIIKRGFIHIYYLGVASILLLRAAVFLNSCSRAPDAMHLEDRYEPPSWKYPFGTDSIGRDVFSRVLYGTRISLLIGVSTRTMGLIIGVIIGAISGYFGGRVDSFLQRIVDITLAFPFLLLVISIAIIFTEGLLSVFIALSAVMWASMARLMRSQVLVVKTRIYFCSACFWRINTQIIFSYHSQLYGSRLNLVDNGSGAGDYGRGGSFVSGAGCTASHSQLGVHDSRRIAGDSGSALDISFSWRSAGIHRSGV